MRLIFLPRIHLGMCLRNTFRSSSGMTNTWLVRSKILSIELGRVFERVIQNKFYRLNLSRDLVLNLNPCIRVFKP